MRIAGVLVTALVSAGLAPVSVAQPNAEEPVGTLARISGTAVVNQGAQYVVGREGMPLREGDRVLALEGGSALVLFADGCQHSVGDDELLVVPGVSTCAARDAVAVDVHKVEPYRAIAEEPADTVGQGFRPAQVGGEVADGDGAGVAFGAAGSQAALPAIVAAAVGIGSAVDQSVNDDDDPSISP